MIPLYDEHAGEEECHPVEDALQAVKANPEQPVNL
jgi:hypothetical protein